MTQLLKILPLFAALAASSAFAAEPDPHAGHHPAAADAAATADAKPAMNGCSMMEGMMPAGSAAMAGKGPDGEVMMDGKDMHCMGAPAAAKGVDAPHDHVHPDAATPK